MVKDLLPKLQAASMQAEKASETSKQIDAKEKKKHTILEMNTISDVNKNFSSSTNEFLKNLENIKYDIDNIENNNTEIRRLQAQVLGGTIQQQVEESRAKLDDRVAENKKIGIRIRNALKKEQDTIDDESIQASKDDTKEKSSREKHEMRLKRTQLASHSKRFYDLWSEYNSQQVDYRDRSKDLLKRRCRIVNADISEDEIETMLDEGKTQMFNASILEDTTKAREQLNELKDRHNEFLKIENSIRDVYELFMELQALVEQQGESVDTIARLVENAEDAVHEGAKDLAQAHKYQSNSRRMKLICGLISMIILIVVVVVIITNVPIS